MSPPTAIMQKAAKKGRPLKRGKQAIAQQTRRAKKCSQNSSPNQTISDEDKIIITSGEGSEASKKEQSFLDTNSGANEPKAKRIQNDVKEIQSRVNDVVKKAKQVEMCQELFEAIMNHKTDEGRLLCKSFIRIPNIARLPDYYDIIENPIDLLEIEQKLETKEYTDIQQFTSDVALIFKNTTSYYEESSREYLDACDLWRVFSDAKTAIHEREVKREDTRKTEHKCTKIDDYSKQRITGYDLYASETRSSYIAANPDVPLEFIGSLLKKEWRQLPIPSQVDYEVRAHYQNEKLRAKLSSESKTQPPVDEKNGFYCLWNNCNQIFDNSQDLFCHLASVPNGHIQKAFKNKGPDKFERKCLWLNCQRTKNYSQPFSRVSLLIRHVKEVHLRLFLIDDITLLSKGESVSIALPPVDPKGPSSLLNKPTEDYVFEGKRLVDLGYFIKSLQGLNDHEGRKCNFFDMSVYAETKHGSIDGIVLKCKLCPTTKVIWLEDPGTDELPPYLAILKPKSQKLSEQKILSVISSAPQTLKCSTQLQQITQSALTPPPLNDTPAGHLQPHIRPQIAMQMRKLPNYPNPQLLKESATLRNCPPQPTAQTQQYIDIQTKVPNIEQSQAHAIDQSQVPLTDFPPAASIKQEIVLPNEWTIPSSINSSPELTRVKMEFYVDQDENATEPGSVPSDVHTPMDVTESIIITPSVLAHDHTRIHCLSGQMSSSSMAMTRDSSITDAIPVDLNLVKKEPVDDLDLVKEVKDETLDD